MLEALLSTSFDDLTDRAAGLEASSSADVALVAWLREAVSIAHNYTGAIAAMVAAIANEESALHAIIAGRS